MLKNLLVMMASVLTTAVPAWAATHTEIKSVYTDTKQDCVVVSQANASAVIDFSDSVCKAFGGYELHIAGGDLRYHPTLAYAGQEIDLGTPSAFHDPGSDKIEWIYSRLVEEDGGGTLAWKGLIFRLNVSNPSDPNAKDLSVLYAVRLEGAKSCLVGTAADNKSARQLVLNSRPGCR